MTTQPVLRTVPPAVSAPAVELTGITRSYGRGDSMVRALAGISLTCPTGTWTAVMGPSGSGKSTLLHCAAGLERVSSGQVWLGNRFIHNASDRTLTDLRRRQVGFIFQSFNLMGALTAEQNVALPLRLGGNTVRRSEVRAALAAVGLADRGRHRPRELSGGQQQRVAIARALAMRPQVLFADEPTGALDTVSARNVLGLLRDLVDDAGQTIVMVTHDPIAAASADTVVFLADGRLIDRLHGATAATVATRLAALEG